MVGIISALISSTFDSKKFKSTDIPKNNCYNSFIFYTSETKWIIVLELRFSS